MVFIIIWFVVWLRSVKRSLSHERRKKATRMELSLNMGFISLGLNFQLCFVLSYGCSAHGEQGTPDNDVTVWTVSVVPASALLQTSVPSGLVAITALGAGPEIRKKRASWAMA